MNFHTGLHIASATTLTTAVGYSVSHSAVKDSHYTSEISEIKTRQTDHNDQHKKVLEIAEGRTNTAKDVMKDLTASYSKLLNCVAKKAIASCVHLLNQAKQDE